ncbi:MAG: glycosyltransferase family 4 protein [Steroidobacteraceae bacterium]
MQMGAQVVSPADRLAPPGERIVIVAPSLDIPGGQGVQAEALRTHLMREGYAVTLLPINSRFPRGLRFLQRYRYVRTVVNHLLFLPSLVRLRHADVVHIFSASYWSFLLAPAPALCVARLLRKRTLLHYHNGEAQDHLSRWGMRVHPWLRLADEIVVPSEYLRAIFERHGYQARVVRNVVALECFRYREREPLRPRLVCTRKFERHYGVDVLIRAFALVHARFPDSTLLLAGYGSEGERLRRLAEAVAPGSIRFLGRVERLRVPEVYDQADIFVNAALIDNQPVSVLEAFAAGLPVVSSAVGDLPEMLEGGSAGCLVPPGDAPAIAAAVVQLLEDPQPARAMSRRAHARAMQYSWNSVRQQWMSLYDRSAA